MGLPVDALKERFSLWFYRYHKCRLKAGIRQKATESWYGRFCV